MPARKVQLNEFSKAVKVELDRLDAAMPVDKFFALPPNEQEMVRKQKKEFVEGILTKCAQKFLLNSEDKNPILLFAGLSALEAMKHKPVFDSEQQKCPGFQAIFDQIKTIYAPMNPPPPPPPSGSHTGKDKKRSEKLYAFAFQLSKKIQQPEVMSIEDSTEYLKKIDALFAELNTMLENATDKKALSDFSNFNPEKLVLTQKENFALQAILCELHVQHTTRRTDLDQNAKIKLYDEKIKAFLAINTKDNNSAAKAVQASLDVYENALFNLETQGLSSSELERKEKEIQAIVDAGISGPNGTHQHLLRKINAIRIASLKTTTDPQKSFLASQKETRERLKVEAIPKELKQVLEDFEFELARLILPDGEKKYFAELKTLIKNKDGLLGDKKKSSPKTLLTDAKYLQAQAELLALQSKLDRYQLKAILAIKDPDEKLKALDNYVKFGFQNTNEMEILRSAIDRKQSELDGAQKNKSSAEKELLTIQSTIASEQTELSSLKENPEITEGIAAWFALSKKIKEDKELMPALGLKTPEREAAQTRQSENEAALKTLERKEISGERFAIKKAVTMAISISEKEGIAKKLEETDIPAAINDISKFEPMLRTLEKEFESLKRITLQHKPFLNYCSAVKINSPKSEKKDKEPKDAKTHLEFEDDRQRNLFCLKKNNAAEKVLCPYSKNELETLFYGVEQIPVEKLASCADDEERFSLLQQTLSYSTVKGQEERGLGKYPREALEKLFGYDVVGIYQRREDEKEFVRGNNHMLYRTTNKTNGDKVPYTEAELKLLTDALLPGLDNPLDRLHDMLKSALSSGAKDTPLGEFPRKKIQEILGYDILTEHKKRERAADQATAEETARNVPNPSGSGGNPELENRLREQLAKVQREIAEHDAVLRKKEAELLEKEAARSREEKRADDAELRAQRAEREKAEAQAKASNAPADMGSASTEVIKRGGVE